MKLTDDLVLVILNCFYFYQVNVSMFYLKIRYQIICFEKINLVVLSELEIQTFTFLKETERLNSYY